jgi:hypothetical protein
MQIPTRARTSTLGGYVTGHGDVCSTSISAPIWTDPGSITFAGSRGHILRNIESLARTYVPTSTKTTVLIQGIRKRKQTSPEVIQCNSKMMRVEFWVPAYGV